MSIHSGRPVAFVIIPFSEYFDSIFKDLITPALAEYDVIRADSRLDQHSILESIVRGINDATLVLADVTTLNPNVMYELGVAHALGKPTVMISQSIGSLPFDIRAYPVQGYSTHFSKASDLSSRLRDIADKHLKGLLKFGNPVLDFLPISTRRAVETTAQAAVSDTPIDLGLPDGYGWVDYSADLEEFSPLVIGGYERLGQLNQWLTSQVATVAPDIKQARSSGAAGSSVLLRKLFRQLAEDMTGYARSVETEVLPPFHDGWDRVSRAMLWMILQRPKDSADMEGLARFRDVTKSHEETLTKTAGQIAEVREVIIQFRGQTSELTQAINVTEQVLNAVIGEILIASSYAARMLALSASVSDNAV